MDLPSSLTLKVFVLSDFEENCYLLFNKERRNCIVIDPGAHPCELIKFIREKTTDEKGNIIYGRVIGVNLDAQSQDFRNGLDTMIENLNCFFISL